MGTGVLDIVAALRDLCEPDPTPPALPTVIKDLAGAQPFAWTPGTLYVYPTRNVETPIETGPTARQDFTVTAVYVDDSGEEPDQERDPAVSARLDAKRDAYMAVARTHRTTTVWHHIRAAEANRSPRTLQARAVAIDFSGFRIVP